MMYEIKRKKKGFTLAELLTVAAIIGIIAAFGFAAVVQHQRNLKLTEADNIAKEIYGAAQNRLTDVQSTGIWGEEYASYADASDEAKDAYYGAVFKQENDTTFTVTVSDTAHDFRTISVNADNAERKLSGTALKYILPYGSMEETIRSGGTYVIEYDAAACQVYGVFYTEDQNFDEEDVSAIDGMTGGRGEKSNRLQYEESADGKKYAVGYYGGAEAMNTSASDTEEAVLEKPEAELINGDRLYLKVSYTDSTAALNRQNNTSLFLYENIIIQDSDGNEQTYIKNAAVQTDGGVEKAVSYTNDSGTVTQYFVLDSIVDGTDYHFSNQFYNLTGRNIKAEVILTYGLNSNYEKSAVGRSNTANSLFADGSSVSVSNDTATVKTARIANARHLENLSYEMSSYKNASSDTDRNELNIQKALILNDIDWQNFFTDIDQENTEYGLSGDQITDTGSHTVYLATGNYGKEKTYFGIVSSTLTDVRSVKGTYTLSNFHIEPSASLVNESAASSLIENKTVNNSAGLFASLSASGTKGSDVTIYIRNLILEDFTVNGTHSAKRGTKNVANSDIGAGLLAVADGRCNKYNLKNITVNDLKINDFDTAGGIVGTVGRLYGDEEGEDYSVKMTISSSTVSAPEINGEIGLNGYLGGLIGIIRTKGDVKVDHADVEDPVIARTGGSEPAVAGAIAYVTGWADLTVTDTSVYSTSDDSGKENAFLIGKAEIKNNPYHTAGGLIGKTELISSVNISNSSVVSQYGTVNAYGRSAGGIIGEAGDQSWNITISDCYSSLSKVQDVRTAWNASNNTEDHSTDYGIGGFIGTVQVRSKIVINRCYVAGRTANGSYDNGYNANVYAGGNDCVGGFIGKGEGTLEIADCYTTASVYSNAHAMSSNQSDKVNKAYTGGFIGKTAELSDRWTTITDCYCTGLVSDAGNTSVKGAFAGYIGARSTITESYALRGINSGLDLAKTDNSGRSSISYTSSSSSVIAGAGAPASPYDSALKNSKYPYKTTEELAGRSGGTHIGDWPLPGNNTNGDIGLLYYEKIQRADGSTYYLYHGYWETLTKSTAGSWDLTPDTATDFKITPMAEDDADPFTNSTGEYVVEDGYAVVLNNQSEYKNQKINGSNILVRSAYTNSYQKLSEIGVSDNSLLTSLGISGSCSAYVIKEPKFMLNSWFSKDNAFYLSWKDGDNYDRVAQFFVNPYSADGVSSSTKAIASDLKETTSDQNSKYFLKIRSARQLAYLFNDSNNNGSQSATIQYLASSNVTVSQEMDIDFSKEFTFAGESVSYAVDGYKQDNFNCIYNGATAATDAATGLPGKHLLKDMRVDYTENLFGHYATGVIENLDIRGAQARSFFTGLQSNGSTGGRIQYVNVSDSKFSGSIFVDSDYSGQGNEEDPDGDMQRGYLSGEIGNIVLSGVTADPNLNEDENKKYHIANGICGQNQGNIHDIVIQNSSITAGNGICTYNNGKTIRNITITNTALNTAEGYNDGNGIARSNAGTITGITIRKDTAMDGSTNAFKHGNGIVYENTWNGTVTDVSIDSYVFEDGNGIAGINLGIIQGTASKPISISNCTMLNPDETASDNTTVSGDDGNGIAAYNGRNISYVSLSNIHAVNGAVKYNWAYSGSNQVSGTLDHIAVSGSALSGNGIAETNTGTIKNSSVSDTAITGNGFVSSNSSLIYNSSIANSSMGGSGFAGRNENSSSKILTADLMNNKTVGAGFIDYNNGYIADCRVYSNSANQDGYSRVTVGLNPSADTSTVQTAAEEDKAGFVNTNALYGIICGSSFAGSVYGSGNVGGFYVYNVGDIYDSYANAIVNYAYRQSTANGYAAGFGVTAAAAENDKDSTYYYNYATHYHDHSTGVIRVVKADDVSRELTGDSCSSIRESGFICSLKPYQSRSSYRNNTYLYPHIKNCYSAVWSMQTDQNDDSFLINLNRQNNNDIAKKISNNATLNVNDIEESRYSVYGNSQLVKHENASELANDSSLGVLSSSNQTVSYPYYQLTAAYTNADYPYPMPHKVTTDESGNISPWYSVDKGGSNISHGSVSAALNAYGDWLEDVTETDSDANQMLVTLDTSNIFFFDNHAWKTVRVTVENETSDKNITGWQVKFDFNGSIVRYDTSSQGIAVSQSGTAVTITCSEVLPPNGSQELLLYFYVSDQDAWPYNESKSFTTQ